jgi:HlyD family secretion protein
MMTIASAARASQKSIEGPRLRRAHAAVIFASCAGALAFVAWRHFAVPQRSEWPGAVEATEIRVGSRVGGRVAEVRVDEGDRVRAGQVIALLEAPDLDAQLMTAKGQLEEAESFWSKLKAGARLEELAQATAHVRTAAAGFRAARIKALLGSSAASAFSGARSEGAAAAPADASVAERDERASLAAEMLAASRRADLNEAQAQVDESTAAERLVRAGPRDEDLRAAEGRVLQARGGVARAQALVDELTIRAPRAGTAEAIPVHPGDVLLPDATAATVVDDDHLIVRFYVPETQLGQIHTGDRVSMGVDSYPDREFAGVIESVSSSGEYSPRNLQTADERANQVFAACARVTESREALRAGMAARVRAAQ